MVIKVTFLAAFLALAASEQAWQHDYQDQYHNGPSYQYQGLQNQEQQYYNYNPQYQGPYNYPDQYQGPYNYPGQYQGSYNYPGQYQGSYNYPGQYQGSYTFRQYEFNPNDAFRQYEVIALVNNENEPLGYIYSVNFEAAHQQKENFVPVRDVNGNLVAYYSWRQYRPGQDFTVQPLSENVVSQLQQFGFNYNQQNKEGTGVLVVRNPNVFYFNENGVLSPKFLENSGYYQRHQAGYPYYGQYSQNYGYRYSQQYYGPYYQQYQGPNAQYQYPGAFSQQYQGPYARYPFNYYPQAAAY